MIWRLWTALARNTTLVARFAQTWQEPATFGPSVPAFQSADRSRRGGIERLRSDLLFAANRDFLREAEVHARDLVAGEQIEGLIHPREGLLLYTLARRACVLGNVIEIGAYHGRSTWYLAQALKDSGSPYKVISIDPHLDPKQRRAFLSTLDFHRLWRWVDPRVARSHDVAATFDDEPIGMVWIDGDHSYKAVREDFDDWFPRLKPGGWFAMHDTVNSWLGPTKLARDLLGHRADLNRIGIVWLTLFAQKTPASTLNQLAGVKARASFDLLTLLQARHNGFGPQHSAPGE